MIKRFKIDVLDGSCTVGMTSHRRGEYVRYGDVAHFIEEKTIEQHLAEFEGWTANSTKKDIDGEYSDYHTALEWEAWKAAKGVEE